MKIISLFVVIGLAVSCKENAKQERFPAKESTSDQTNINTEPTIGDLKQNGNYNSLFSSPDCKVITAKEISAVLGITFVDMNRNTLCSFKSEGPNGKTWYLNIVRNDMSKSDIQREIQSFKSDETGRLVLQISETGDTYLCNQHSNGYVSIYNPNYSGNVLISYGSAAESRAFTKEERMEHRDFAFVLANALLKKYQK